MVSYGISHIGKVRSTNQDAYLNVDGKVGCLDNIYIVADGMGGHLGGEEASRMAVDTIFSVCSKAGGMETDILIQGIESANLSIFERSVKDSSLFGMGTTVDAVTVKDEVMSFAHVGDSRIYVADDKELIQVTRDHSYVQELLDAGAITEDEAYNHPNKNRITRAVGVDKELEIDRDQLTIDSRWQYILLCSDGLTNMMKDNEILDVMNQHVEVKDITESLLSIALENGGVDNISIVLIDLKGGPLND